MIPNANRRIRGSSKLWTTILAGGMSLIAIFALGISVSRWRDGAGVEILITGVSAFGTLALAAATFYSVRHSIRNISEMEKEREKPIVQDEIVKVIQPAINALYANAERLDSKKGIDWVYSRPSSYNANSTSDRVSSVFVSPVPVAMVRLQETRPDLWSELENHQEIIEELSKLGETIDREMQTPLQICAEELDWNMPENELNTKLLISAVIKDLDRFGESSDYYDFWENHGEEIKQLVHSLSREEIEKMERLKSRLEEICNNIPEDLAEHKVELQQEFGISESTIDEEFDDWAELR